MTRRTLRSLALACGCALALESVAQARPPRARRARPASCAVARPVDPVYAGTLGTFLPAPYVNTRGNTPSAGGYAPAGIYGDTSLAIYGPLSAFRETTAPVYLDERGYDGSRRVVEAVGFSAPFSRSPRTVVYPSQASNVYGFPASGDPPWWPSPINWIDQN